MNSPGPTSSSPSVHSGLALADLRRGEAGVVEGLASVALGTTAEERDSMLARLRDLGFIPGARCEVIARMWFGGDPIAVRVGGSTFALRRVEAAAVRVMRAIQPAPHAALAPA